MWMAEHSEASAVEWAAAKRTDRLISIAAIIWKEEL
jgi:hypothetical protein